MQVFCSKIGLAPYIEVALYHKKAKALMVTDAVVYIPEDPPEASPYTLLSCMPMCQTTNAGYQMRFCTLLSFQGDHVWSEMDSFLLAACK